MGAKNNVSEVALLSALAAGAALGGVIVFTLLASFWEWGVITGARWWDVAAAIGTLLAVWVALWFGLADVRHRQQERMRANGVYQWLFTSDIGQAFPALNSINDFLDAIEREQFGSKISPAELEYLNELCAAISAKTINAHINALVYLPPDLGQALARVASNGPVLAHRLQMIRSNPVITQSLKEYVPSLRLLVSNLRQSILATRYLDGGLL